MFIWRFAREFGTRIVAKVFKKFVPEVHLAVLSCFLWSKNGEWKMQDATWEWNENISSRRATGPRVSFQAKVKNHSPECVSNDCILAGWNVHTLTQHMHIFEKKARHGRARTRHGVLDTSETYTLLLADEMLIPGRSGAIKPTAPERARERSRPKYTSTGPSSSAAYTIKQKGSQKIR